MGSALLALVSAAFLWLDSEAGHRFLLSRLRAWQPESGLRVDVGSIDGSIYTDMRLDGLSLSDGKGVFFRADRAALDWWPWALLSNRLSVDDLTIRNAYLYREPQLKSTGQGRLLPDFDIRVMRFRVNRLALGPQGSEWDIWRMSGDIDIRSGQAVVDAAVASLRNKDRVRLSADVRPDDNRFDIDASIFAAREGALAHLAGYDRDMALDVNGRGDWNNWNGTAKLLSDGAAVADLKLSARQGDYGVKGRVERLALPRSIGKHPLLSGGLDIDSRLSWANGIVGGEAGIGSTAGLLKLDGGVDIRRGGFDNLSVTLSPRAGPATGLQGQDVAAKFRLDGPFAATRTEYLLTARRLQTGGLDFAGLRARGQGIVNLREGNSRLPLRMEARQVGGMGPLGDRLLRDVRLNADLNYGDGTLSTGNGRLTAAGGRADVSARMTLASGDYLIAMDGKLPDLEIEGVGRTDAAFLLKLLPGAQRKLRVEGRVHAPLERFDIAFLRDLAGGLPDVRMDVLLEAGRPLQFQHVQVRAPALTLTAKGQREAGGIYAFAGQGRHDAYGPYSLALRGRLDRPKVALRLERPNDALGLRQVQLDLMPEAQGFAIAAQGQSHLGPFTGSGQLVTPRGRNAYLSLSGLEVGGVRAAGRLDITGGLSGQLQVSGVAQGVIGFGRTRGYPEIAADLTLRAAEFAGNVPIRIGQGQVGAKVALMPGRTNLNLTARMRGLMVGFVPINRLAFAADVTDGRGKLRGSLSGRQGRPFDMQIDADVEPMLWTIRAQGRFDGQALALSEPARVRMDGAGWTLEPVQINHAGGSARFVASDRDGNRHYDVSLRNLPLTLIDLANRDIGLGGRASGQASYDQQAGRAASGRAELRFAGLSRSGVTRSSPPISLAINAGLSNGRISMRAIARDAQAELGRGQALISVRNPAAPFADLRQAPIRAVARYEGPAQALWRLTGLELFDMTGPLKLGARVGGTLAAPDIEGAMSSQGARIDSPVTGMRVRDVSLSGRFRNENLVVSRLSGTTHGGGGITGSGTIRLSAVDGIGMDLRFALDRAEILDRDDLGAVASGEIQVQSEGRGGRISGALEVRSSRFTLGRAAALAEIPQIATIERNGARDDFARTEPDRPWTFDMTARARNKLMVDGLGLKSEWEARLAIRGPVLRPVLSGTATLIDGDYEFAGRRFTLTSGTILFTGTPTINPELNIAAEASLTGLNANIQVGGTSENPTISFSSIPAMPEDEVLARILFGTSITQLSAPEAVQLAAAVTALQGSGNDLSPINSVRKVAGLDRLRILPADPARQQNTAVAAGKYLGRKTYVELITDGQGYSATRIEYQVTRWLSLLGAVSSLGRQSATVRVSKDY